MLLSAQISAVLLLSACASTPPQSAATPAQAVAPTAEAAAQPSAESLTIGFAADAAILSDEEAAKLDGAARLYRDAQPEVMIVTGHTDKAGEEYRNLLLSARRAAIVKRALIERGVPAERLQLIAAGEAEQTPGKVPGREVIVTWR